MSEYTSNLSSYTVVSEGCQYEKYGKFAALIVVVIGTLVWLATAGMKDNQTYYKTITELGQMGDQGLQRSGCAWAAMSKPGSIQRVGNQVQFVLVQDKTKLKVAYTGTDPLPDTFKDGAQALADGKLGRDGVFRAPRFRPSALRSMKPSRDNCSPDRPLPISTSGKAAASRGVIWKIWVRWPSCWPSAWRSMPPLACVVGRVKRKPFLMVSGERAVYCDLGADHPGVRHPGLRADDRRLPLRLRGRAQQPRHADRSTSSRRGGAGRKARCCSGAGCSPPTPRWWSSPTAASTAT